MEYPRIDYAARDFATIKTALINFIRARFPEDITDFTESNLAMALLELWAWVGDMLSFSIDMSANECFLPTARQRENIVNIVKLIGYRPRPPAAASVELRLSSDGFSQNASVVAGTKIIAGDVTFELLEDYIFPALVQEAGPGCDVPGPVFSAGMTFLESFDGTGEPFQLLELANKPVIRDSEKVFVDGILWERIESLVFAGDSNKYQIDFTGENAAVIRFGNDLSGHIPPIGLSNIEIRYRVGGGAKSNVAANLINTSLLAILGNSTSVQIAATNPLPASGGADEESSESIKFHAPRYVRTHGNAITKEDYDTLVSIFSDPEYGAIAKGIAFPRYGRTNSSANEIDIYVWARTIDGELTSCSLGLKEALLAYLNKRKVIVVDIFIHDGILKPIDLDIQIHFSPNVRKSSDILDAVRHRVDAYFSREELEPGQSFYVSELCHAIMGISGVMQVDIGIPDTQMVVQDLIASSFVIGLATDITLADGGFLPNKFAGGLIRIESGVYASHTYPILSNSTNSIKINAILTSLANGETCTLFGPPEKAMDVPVAENEIYLMGDIAISGYMRIGDTRETIILT